MEKTPELGARKWLRAVVLQRHLGAMRRMAAEVPRVGAQGFPILQY